MILVDASLALAWLFEDERTDETDALLDQVIADGGVVPPLWTAEVANVLAVAERRGRITEADAAHLAGLLERLPLELSETDPPVTEVLGAARRHGLTAYDATYLVLAMREGLDLGTLDADLRAAAARAGVVVRP